MEALTPLITEFGGSVSRQAVLAVKQYFDFIEELVTKKSSLN